MDTETNTADPDSPSFVPPYISFRTLLNLIEKLADESVPHRIDRSVLSHLSGGYQGQVMAALRALNLIDSEGYTTPTLTNLVRSPETRQQVVENIVRDFYPEPMRLAEMNASQAQLEEFFRGYGITGETLRRAVTFYLHAAAFAGIEVSPHFKSGRLSTAPRKPRAAKSRAKRQAGTAMPPPPETKGTDEATESLRTKYIEMLLSKADADADVNSELLDRIEGLLGFRDINPGQPK